MPSTKLLESPGALYEQDHAVRPDVAQPEVRLERRLATMLPLARPRSGRQTIRRIDPYVYFLQLTDLDSRPLPEYVGAELEIVDSCENMRALRTFDSPELAIYFCRVYADQFPHRRFRYRLRKSIHLQCK
jgi:hypothetical protein